MTTRIVEVGPAPTTYDEALLAVGQLCAALADQDVDPHVDWEMTVDFTAGHVGMAVALHQPISIVERDLLLQAATRIASLTKSAG